MEVHRGDEVAPLLTLGWRHAFSDDLRCYADFSGVKKPSGTLTGHLLAGVIYRALAQVMPERIIAECGGAPSMRAVFSGVRNQLQRCTLDMSAQQGLSGVGFAGQCEFLQQTVLSRKIAIAVISQRPIPAPIQFGAVAQLGRHRAEVRVGGTGIWRSTNGGASWTSAPCPVRFHVFPLLS